MISDQAMTGKTCYLLKFNSGYGWKYPSPSTSCIMTVIREIRTTHVDLDIFRKNGIISSDEYKAILKTDVDRADKTDLKYLEQIAKRFKINLKIS